MAPKATSATFIVWSSKGPESIHATLELAVNALKKSKEDSFVKELPLVGGTISVTNGDGKPSATKPAPVKKEVVKKEEDASEEDVSTNKQPAATKRTKTPAQQRADNANKAGKPTDADLPANVKSLLEDGGNFFGGKTVVVTGVPPTLGRKNTERLVEAFGAHLGKSLSKKTDYVVVGNDAGPKKLLQIDELGLKSLDEDELVSLLEGEETGSKRARSDSEDDTKPSATRTKRQKK